MIYLDHNATAPLEPEVAAAMGELLRGHDLDGNPSSVHAAGRRARALIEAARREVAALVGADPLGITFTSGGTEADNLAILGTCRALRETGQPWGLLTSAIEHPAVREAAVRLRAEGAHVLEVPVDGAGRVDSDACARALRDAPEVGLVSVALVHHELGNVVDVASMTGALRAVRPDIIVHTDAVQALGKVAVDLEALGVDLLSISAHKIGGPAGVGALVHRPHARIAAEHRGGHQERGRRPGTESTLLIHGFGVAAALWREQGDARRVHMVRLGARLRDGIGRLTGVRLLGDPQRHAGNTACAHFEGAEGELLVMALDLEGIAVSTGAACSAGTLEPSPAMLALGLSPAEARCVLRVSVGPSTTAEEVDALLGRLPSVLARVRAVATDGPSEGAA